MLWRSRPARLRLAPTTVSACWTDREPPLDLGDYAVPLGEGREWDWHRSEFRPINIRLSHLLASHLDYVPPTLLRVYVKAPELR